MGAARPRREVGVGLGLADALGPPLDANLSSDRMPGEHRTDRRVRVEVTRLARLVVRVEDDPALIDALAQHQTDAGRAVGADGRDRHRVGLRQAGFDGGVEPLPDKDQRLRRQHGLVQTGGLVGTPQPRQIVGVHRLNFSGASNHQIFTGDPSGGRSSRQGSCSPG